MRLLTFVFTFYIPWIAHAVVFQAADITHSKYVQYLNDQRKESVVGYYQERLNQETTFNEQLLQSSELSSPQIILDFVNRSDRPVITTYTLKFLKDFADRSLELKKSKAANEILCFALVLLEQGSTICTSKEVHLEVLKTKLPDYQTLMVEGISFSIQTMKYLKLAPAQTYHFTALSNSRKPSQFVGTWDDFILQVKPQETWVQGGCDNFQTRIEDLSLRLQSEVLFPDCLQPVQQAEEGKSPQTWMQRHKKWVYLSGALLIGAGIYSMKDKNIVIDRSWF